MKKPRSKATPSLAVPEPACSAILSLIPILDAFNHRNKNQHRLSHWWAHFNILRRSLRPFQDGSATILLAHAIWMRDHVVPRSYLSFSQLAADQQHAPLGLMLLAVLAKVHAVLIDINPTEETPQLKPVVSGNVDAVREQAPERSDRGVSVSRNGTLKTSQPAQSTFQGKKRPASEANDEPKTKTKKKKKTRDELSNLFGSLA